MKLIWILLALAALGLLAFSLIRNSRFAPPPRSQRHLPSIAPLPLVPGGGADHGVKVSYVATTVAGRPKDRVAARGLGRRGGATFAIRTDGVLIDRTNAPTLFIPVYALAGVRRNGSTIIIAWNHDEVALETGVGISEPAECDRIFERLSTITDLKGNR